MEQLIAGATTTARWPSNGANCWKCTPLPRLQSGQRRRGGHQPASGPASAGILRGQQSEAELYGRSGQTAADTLSRPLAKA